MEQAISGIWLELSIFGGLVTIVTQGWLALVESPGLCESALEAGKTSRAALLRATWDASDSGWARLIREALRAPASEVGSGYRASANNAPSPAVQACFVRERRRIVRAVAVGASATLLAIASSGLIAVTAGTPAIVAAIVTFAIGARALHNARRALDELETARAEIGTLVARLESPPPLEKAEPPTTRTLQSPTAFGYVFLLLCIFIYGGLIVSAAAPVPANQIMTRVFVHLFVGVFFVAAVTLLSGSSLEVDVARGVAVVTSRLLGVRVSRVVIPLEIAKRFGAETARSARSSSTYLGVATTVGDPILIIGCDKALAIADELNALLERIR